MAISSSVHNNKFAYIWIIATCTVPIIAILIMNFVKTRNVSSDEAFQNQSRARPETYYKLVHLITNISFAMACGDASNHDDGYNRGTELPLVFEFSSGFDNNNWAGSPCVEFLETSEITYHDEYIKMREDSAEQAAYNISHVIIVVVSVCVTLTSLLLISCLYNHLCKKKRRTDGEENHNEHQGSTETTFELCSPRPFTFEELSRATNNFHQDQILGKGGFGAVYKAVFPNGQTAVVKRVSSTSQQGIKEYTAEVTIVCRSNHRHLVQLIDWCHEIKGELLLVYELMENKSLDVHLFDPNMDTLAWSVRYKTAQGFAKALRYLHEECNLLCTWI
ncbi:Concanavalin A-like lectin/glucanase superfamily [Artemisia annua]|uniref:Concanavalin A-like lectin/glucanase superfamily n=1 Tax=Artemisia annua TaxID=35608 RepID=A0A2U1LMN3_ARTAN|nr:Concanavalin A-like lectin/glucanase superfamily [Artemisia annua]